MCFLFICTGYQIPESSSVAFHLGPSTYSTAVRKLINGNLLLLCAWMIQTQPLGTVLDYTIILDLHKSLQSAVVANDRVTLPSLACNKFSRLGVSCIKLYWPIMKTN